MTTRGSIQNYSDCQANVLVVALIVWPLPLNHHNLKKLSRENFNFELKITKDSNDAQNFTQKGKLKVGICLEKKGPSEQSPPQINLGCRFFSWLKVIISSQSFVIIINDTGLTA